MTLVSLPALCQSTNADLRNLLLRLDPEGMRDGLRTAAKTKSATVRGLWYSSTHVLATLHGLV